MQEILTKAIEKAIANGYVNDYQWKLFNGHLANEDDDYAHPYPLIFNHDFARALWPYSEQPCPYCSVRMFSHLRHYSHCPYSKALTEPLLWEFHLQQMVIADDPIAYLGANI